MERIATAVAATVFALLAVPATAQAQDPQSVAAELLAADSSGDWRTVLRVADPEAVNDFRNQQVAMLTLLLNPDPRQAAFMQRVFDSTQARTMSVFWKAQRARMLDSVYHVPSIDSLAALPADSVLARWYRGRSRRWRSSDPHYKIIGTLQPSDTIAYVVLELAWSSPPFPPERMGGHGPPLQVLVIRKHERQWRAMLDIVPNPVAGLGPGATSDSL